MVDDNVDAAAVAGPIAPGGRATRFACATTVRGRWRPAAKFRPDLAVLDIGLPGMDGYEVARALRADQPADRSLLLVAVTGYGGPDADAEGGRRPGFDHHLVKPVDPDVLLGLLAGRAPVGV